MRYETAGKLGLSVAAVAATIGIGTELAARNGNISAQNFKLLGTMLLHRVDPNDPTSRICDTAWMNFWRTSNQNTLVVYVPARKNEPATTIRCAETYSRN